MKSSLGRKVLMAVSGLFLVIFLLQHFTINLTSIFSKEMFNSISHFMGNNPLVQFILQPILIFGVVFHFIMGFILELKNRESRSQNYSYERGGASSSWISRNMIYSGLVILLFLGLHFYDFWIPEIQYKYLEFLPENPNRYYDEMIHKFNNPIRVVIYIVSFIFLSLHLLHGFSSSFQTVGFNNKYSSNVIFLTKAFSIIIPLGFILIAIIHFLNAY
tara:strand:- start:940 stop:1590 length:651 start_codon:yes stop_codon:yes gene_type:complete